VGSAAGEKTRISPDSSVGSMDSRAHSECGSLRSRSTPPNMAMMASSTPTSKSMDRSDVESIATTTSHDSREQIEEENAIAAVPLRRKPSPPIVEEPAPVQPVQTRTRPKANERFTKEEIQMQNLKKKTRKRTRKFEIDGVQVTTTTSKVIYGDDENGRLYDDHLCRKQELRELKMLQKQEKKQFHDLQLKEQIAREQQEKKFEQERIALERTYEADMDVLARQYRQTVEKIEQQQETELRNTSKKIRSEQERELKLVSRQKFL
jgi:STE20-like kinase